MVDKERAWVRCGREGFHRSGDSIYKPYIILTHRRSKYGVLSGGDRSWS